MEGRRSLVVAALLLLPDPDRLVDLLEPLHLHRRAVDDAVAVVPFRRVAVCEPSLLSAHGLTYKREPRRPPEPRIRGHRRPGAAIPVSSGSKNRCVLFAMDHVVDLLIRNPPMPDQSTATAQDIDKPLPKGVQRVILVVMLAGVAGFIYWTRSSADCTTRSFLERSDGDHCELEGKVERVSAETKAANDRLEHSGARLDEFYLIDEAGRALIYFPEDEMTLPGDGDRVRVEATVMNVASSGIRRLVASDITVK
jgi:hypothetical protein